MLLFGLLLSYQGIFSQQTAAYTTDLTQYNKAIELYENDQFLAAQTLFARVKDKTDDKALEGDCAYYVAECAIRLNQENGDVLMEKFVEEYPTSVKRNEAFINVGNYYFENGKYTKARKWYGKVAEKSLSRKEREKFYFNNGYALFKGGSNNAAKKYLSKVEGSKKYGAQAKYYLGFIAYAEDDYETASALFEEVKGDERYAQGLPYYQADMNFKLGNFQLAIDMGKEIFETSEPKEKSELAKIIGESYFNLGQYAEAIPYLKEYKGKRGRWNNTDYYLLGYAYYKQGQYEDAINEFNKIVDGRDHVAQNAFYHLAESYLRLDRKPEALNAFKNASEMDFSAEIQQDAWLNYAKLSYEIGNSYQSVPEVLLSFIERYPDDPNNEELKDLLIDSYISSRNFGAALDLMENNRSFENKQAYQLVAFFRGIELYVEGNYQEAITYFDKSLKEPLDPEYTARAVYWKAESDFQLSNFGEALVGYKQFRQLPEAQKTQEYKNFNYNLAYNYFNMKNYDEAITYFGNYVSSTNAEAARKRDAYLRLGDSYFVTSKYWPAMDNYNQAIELGTADLDYALFRKALSYGFVDRPTSKIDGLKDIVNGYPKSVYRDDALYELGNTYLAQDRTNEAIGAYDQLITEIPGSTFVAQALLKKALILDNTGKSNEALSLFKRVANDYPSRPEALQAVSSAKIIYIDQGRVDEYANWVNALDFVEVEDAELDDATYQAAEQPYLQNNASVAIERFEEYVRQFPNGRHALHANFYLSQLYFGAGEKEKAIPGYEYVVSQERSEFTEQSLSRVAELYLTKEDYRNALTYLKRLEVEADFPQNVVFAQTNSMKASYELKQYEEAVDYAEKVLENPKVDNAIKSDAQIIIARSAIETGNESKARNAYAEVSKIATGELAAEALYYNAYFKHKDGDHKGSNVLIQKLAKNYSGYKYYGAKGLVLMAKNFYELKDAYQATYILESVIKNFADYPEIVEEAQTELSSIKAAVAKTNASVETNEN